MVRNSLHKAYANERESLLKRFGPKARLAAFLTLVFVMTNTTLFSQDKGRKVEPTSRGTIDIREIEKREKESGREEQRKKIENENLEVPGGLPVPKDAKGKTFRTGRASEKRKHAPRRRKKRTHRQGS